MGGLNTKVNSTDTNNQLKNLNKSEIDLVQMMFPLYYAREDVTESDRTIASISWGMILNDESPEYLTLREDSSFNYFTVFFSFMILSLRTSGSS